MSGSTAAGFTDAAILARARELLPAVRRELGLEPGQPSGGIALEQAIARAKEEDGR